MAVSNLHQGVVAGAAGDTGVTFDPNLILNSIYLHGSGTSGDAMLRQSRTPGNRNRWLFGTWYHPLRVPLASGDRITIFAAGASGAGFYLSHEEEGDLRLFHRDESGNEGAVVTTEMYRDVTSWIHILVDYDSANAEEDDRISLYVNGTRVGVNSGTRPAQNKSIMVNTEGEIERIGQDFSTTPNYHGAMYLAQTFLMDNKSIVNGDHVTTDFLDTFTLGTNGSQIIPKSNDDIKTLVAAAGVNSFFLNYEDTTAKGSVAGVVRDRKATESTNHVLGITPTMSEGVQAGAAANVANGFRRAVQVEATGTNLTLVFDLGSGNGQAVQSVSFTCEGTTSFANDAGQGGGSQSNGRIKDLNISGSNNGTDYTTLSDAGDVAQQRSGSLYTLSWTNSTTYRYLKFANVGVHGGSRSNVGGIGFYTEQSPVIGNDFWGNGDLTAASSIVTANQKRHSPSKVYPVLNPLSATDTADMTLEDGNLVVTPTTNQRTLFASKGLTSGAWYFEVKVVAFTSGGGMYLGVGNYGHADDNNYQGYNSITSAIAVETYSGNYADHGGNTDNTSLTGTNVFAANDIVGIAVDIDNGKFWYAKNNTWADGVTPAVNGSGASSLSWKSGDGPWFPFISRGGSYSDKQEFRFESGDFSYTPPAGFKEINSANLSAPDYQGIDYFDTTLYEGNGDNQRVGDFVPFTDTFAIGNSAMWYSEDIRRLRHTYSSEAAATSDNSSDSAVYRKVTISFWVKFIETNDSDQQTFISAGNAAETERFQMYAHGTDDIVYVLIDPSGSDNNRTFKFAKGLLSTQNWSNVVIHLDTNNSTAADRMKVWINGNAVTNTETSRPYTAMTQGQNSFLFADEQIMIGHLTPSDTYNSVYNFNSYLAEFHVIDGYNKAVSDFGQVDTSTNRWVPKDYKTNVGTYGNRGFYLKFDGTPGAGSGSDMGKDSSGNNIHFTEETHGSGSAWATTDKFIDSPSKNFATFDRGYSGGGSNTISEGGTRVKGTDGSNSDSAVTTFGMTGKVVFDFKFHTVGGGYPKVGFITGQEGLDDINKSSGSIELGTSNLAGSVAFGSTGSFYIPMYADSTEMATTISTGQSIDADDVIRYEVDTNAGTVRVYFQNEGTGSFTEITAARIDNFHFDPVFGVRPAVSNYNNSEVSLLTGGQASLSSVSTGFLEMNQDNLDATASKLTAWAWIKNRDAGDSHVLVDRVRGVGKRLQSDSSSNPAQTNEEGTVMRFLQRGNQVGGDDEVNTANESYVLWQWLVGDSATTGSTLTGGSPDITSTGIVADAGHFSVGVYEGSATDDDDISHGLGGTIEMLWVKHFAADTDDWMVWHKDLSSNSHQLHLNTTDDEDTTKNAWGSNPVFDANVFRVGITDETNKNSTGNSHVFYAFRSIPGVCKIGSYEGNGVAAGPYVSVGFRPKFVLIKAIDVDGYSWSIFDFVRSPANGVATEFAHPNSDTAAYTSSGTLMGIDFLSDGFTQRSSHASLNQNGSKYLYMAIADIAGNGTLPPIYGI